MGMRNSFGAAGRKIAFAGTRVHGPEFSARSTGRWLLTTICPVRLGRCNSLLRGGDSHGRAQAYATVLLFHRCQHAERRHMETCARRGTPCNSDQAPPALKPVTSEDCPKRRTQLYTGRCKETEG